MKPMLTVIAYKENSDDYCRNCHMASYSSDFKMLASIDEDKIVVFWGDILVLNKNMKIGEAGYDIKLLVNGTDYGSVYINATDDDEDCDDKAESISKVTDRILARAEQYAEVKQAELEAVKAQEEKKQADKKAEEKKRQELELLAELKRKHEGA